MTLQYKYFLRFKMRVQNFQLLLTKNMKKLGGTQAFIKKDYHTHFNSHFEIDNLGIIKLFLKFCEKAVMNFSSFDVQIFSKDASSRLLDAVKMQKSCFCIFLHPRKF